MPPRLLALLFATLLVAPSARAEETVAPVAAYLQAHRDGAAPNSIAFDGLTGDRSRLPIGVFDSGIGGLTVLQAILAIDTFNNQTLQPGADGVPDFEGEEFVYLGDQANMPYGNYPARGAEPYLKELILKDAIFLLGSRKKPPVKAIVIACNTATAYGLEEIRALLATLKLDVPVIGVVEAGARAVAAELPDDGRARSVAVLATVGTCASNAYPKAIGTAVGRTGKRVPTVVQQGSVGLAGAIEGSPAFLPRRGAEVVYEGPKLEPPMLPVYRLDPSGLSGNPAQPDSLKLASVRNYARYDVTTLLQKSPPPAGAPIEIVVLGCTHFPMARVELAEAFTHARTYQNEDGARPFAEAVSPDLRFVDPAEATAKELFRELARARLRRKEGPPARPTTFFLTEPNPAAGGVPLTADGALTAEYKQGRKPGRLEFEDTMAVRVNAESLPGSARVLVQSLPEVWRRLAE
jgi:glutamate racemase